jgi:hypothetical protein
MAWQPPSTPAGALFCTIDRRTQGRAWAPSTARAVLRRAAIGAGV